jgi:acyl-CoA synthetase (AMP-forming)/AMP-acid ligase II
VGHTAAAAADGDEASTSTPVASETASLDRSGAAVVAIIMLNSVEFILAFLAVPWTRSVSAPLNQDYTKSEFQFYMEDNASQLVLVPDIDGIPEAEAAAAALGLPVYSIGYRKNKENNQFEVEVKRKAGPPRIASARSPRRPTPCRRI